MQPAKVQQDGGYIYVFVGQQCTARYWWTQAPEWVRAALDKSEGGAG